MGFTPNPRESEQTVTMSPAQLQELIAAAVSSSVKTMVEEMKKPTAEEARKLAEEEILRTRHRNEMIMIAEEEIRTKKAFQDACDHKKPNGQYATGGQVFGDGIERHLCLRCQKWIYVSKVQTAAIAGGFGNVTDSF